MKKPLLLVSCAGIFLLAASLSTRTLAQQPDSGSGSPAQQAPQKEIAPEELQRFAKAVKQLQAIDQSSKRENASSSPERGVDPSQV